MAEQKNLCYNCFQERESPEGPCPYCGFDLAENEKKFPVALRAGTILNGRYIVGRVLGQGGFGITYLAWDTKLEARVAVKEFMPNEIATRVGTTVSVAVESRTQDFTYGAERFQEEARTLAKFMGQPNIAGVTDYFDENDTSYFVMDYIEGISFKTYIANHGGKISVEEALNVMIPVLRALTAVHAEGFIHRDVTPDNIYITKDGMVKLLDFGSARYSIGDKSKSLDVILKVGYAPKEQYIRRSRQGPFTDVYSCAACFYAAITGFLPPESLERMDEDTLVPISQCGIEIPEYLDKAILKGLAVQPEDRFQSAAEFLDAIENQQVVEVPVSGAAAAPTAGGQLDALISKVKQKPKLYGAIAAAAVVVLVAVGVLTGGSGGGSGDGRPLLQSPVPSITIAGQTYSTDERNLELEGMGLTDADIQDLQYMVNLTRLNLGNNQITDLNPLSELTQLSDLRLNGNDITDVSPLANMTSLEHIDLRENPNLSDLSPLAGLTNISEVEFYDCPVTDISFLSSWTNLTYLQLGDIGQMDLAPLSGLTNLTSLHINGSNNDITDLTWLSELTKLQELSIYGSLSFSDLTPLSGLTELRSLHISGSGSSSADMRAANLDVFAGMAKLQELQLDVSGLEDLSGLSGLTSLTSLRLYGSQNDPDLSPISGLTKLQSLDLTASSRESGYYEDDLSFLSPLHDLRALNAVIHGLKNFSGLEGLTSLTDLQLQGDFYITDLSPISGLTELRNVYLGQGGNSFGLQDCSALSQLSKMESFTIDADLQSLEGIEGMASLRELNLYGKTLCSDLSPLSALTSLEHLYLSGTAYGEISAPYDLSALASLTNLRELRLSADVSSFEPLASLQNLESLEIYNGNTFDDRPLSTAPLGRLTSLAELSIYDSDLTDDLSFLSGLTNLRTLQINLRYDSPVRNLEPLRNLGNLTSLTVSGSDVITDWSAVDHVVAVTKN